MNAKTIAFCGIIGAILFIGTAIISGFQFDHYSHISQFISEGYATGTTYGIYLRVIGYIPSGILLFVFGICVYKYLAASGVAKAGFIGFAIFYGLGTVIVSLFPCDPGCNSEWVNPSNSQIIHRWSGFLTYLLVPASLIAVGAGLKRPSSGFLVPASFIFGILSGVFSLILFADPTSEIRGLIQRVIELAVLFWVFFVSFYLLKIRAEH